MLAGRTNPPNYLTDFNLQPVRFNLAQQTGEMLPLPAGNGFSTAVSLMDGRVLFGGDWALGRMAEDAFASGRAMGRAIAG